MKQVLPFKPTTKHRSVYYLFSALMLFFFQPFLAHAQEERQSATLPVISEKVSWSLDKATGWMKNREGQWIEAPNKILKTQFSLANKAAWVKDWNISGFDNFIRFEIREMELEGFKFLILIKIMNDGYFKYPASQQGWEPMKKARYYVIKHNDTKGLNNGIEDYVKKYDMQIYFCNWVLYDEDYLNRIALDISKTNTKYPDMKKYGSTASLLLEYVELKDGKTVRFHMAGNKGGLDGNNVYPIPDDRFNVMLCNECRFPIGYYFELPKTGLTGMIDLISKP